jgi:hypothetical protein
MLDIPGISSYCAGMNRSRVQYTLRSVPPAVDLALRQRARREGKSLNEVVLDALAHGAGLHGPVYTDLDDGIGTWREDPAFDAALKAQRRVNRPRCR